MKTQRNRKNKTKLCRTTSGLSSRVRTRIGATESRSAQACAKLNKSFVRATMINKRLLLCKNISKGQLCTTSESLTFAASACLHWVTISLKASPTTMATCARLQEHSSLTILTISWFIWQTTPCRRRVKSMGAMRQATSWTLEIISIILMQTSLI